MKVKNLVSNARIWIREHAAAGALILTIIMTVFYSLPKTMRSLMPEMESNFVFECIMTAYAYYLLPLALALITGYGWIYKRGKLFKTLLICFFMIVMAFYFALISLYYMIDANPDIELLPDHWIVLGLFKVFGIGFFEETFFRGIVGNLIGEKYGKDRKGVWFSVVLSALYFGLVHMLNMRYGVSFSSALFQSLSAWISGMGLCAGYYRGGSIWAMMIIHALIDFGPLFESTFTVSQATDADAINQITWVTLIPAIPYAIMAVIFLRKKKIPEIVEKLQEHALKPAAAEQDPQEEAQE